MSVRSLPLDEEEEIQGLLQRKNPELIFEQNKNVKEKGKRALI